MASGYQADGYYHIEITGGNNSSVGFGGNFGNQGNHDGVRDNTNIILDDTKNYNGAYMAMCVNNLKAHEGFKNDMYKDQDGNITVGIGHLISTSDMAAALPFSRTQTTHGHGDTMENEVAISKGDIISAFNAYNADSKNLPMMHLSNDAVINVCINDVQTTETGLRGLYSGYDSFPEHAKVALVDMGFNLGVPRLTHEFPKFNAAVNNKDWNTAATESHRTLHQNGDQRNKDTAAQLQQAAQGH